MQLYKLCNKHSFTAIYYYKAYKVHNCTSISYVFPTGFLSCIYFPKTLNYNLSNIFILVSFCFYYIILYLYNYSNANWSFSKVTLYINLYCNLFIYDTNILLIYISFFYFLVYFYRYLLKAHYVFGFIFFVLLYDTFI